MSSIRSKQTGHVGSSTNEGVGGATGFVEREEGVSLDEVTAPPVALDASDIAWDGCGVRGSFLRFGKVEESPLSIDVWNRIDLMKTT